MKIKAMAYKLMVEECRQFLASIDGAGEVEAAQMDAHVFGILRAATSVVQQQQAEYLDFMCLEENEEKFNEWASNL